MRRDRDLASSMRQKGDSYNKISARIGVSKSTLNYWFKNKLWSKKVKSKLTQDANKQARKRMILLGIKSREKRRLLYQQKRMEARRLYKIFHKDLLFMSGLMIYWGEGDSKLINGQIRVANSNVLMLKLFHYFILRYLPAVKDKIRVYLVLYPDLKDSACREYWSGQLGIPIDKFFKSQYIKGRSSGKKLPFGVGTIIVSSRAYKEIVIEWLKLRQKEISLMRFKTR